MSPGPGHNDVRGRSRISAIARHHWEFPFKGHAILIWGALAATLLGALTALRVDHLIAAGERLMHPVGQEALIRTTATAGLTGLLCWVVCALVTRAISRHALRPYNALADHLERLADGEGDRPIDLHGPEAGVRRMARAVVFHHQALASRRSEADLQARYDRLYQEHADERRLLMGAVMDRRREADDLAPDLRVLVAPAPVDFEVPARPAALVASPPSRTGEVVDLAGRLRSAARAVEAPADRSPVADDLSLDFVFTRR